MQGLPEGLELVRFGNESKLAENEYLLATVEHDAAPIVRCKPGYTMAYQLTTGQHRPIRCYDTPKRLDLTFDGFTMSFEITNAAQDEAVREAFEHLRHKLLTRVGVSEIELQPEGVYS